MTTQITFGSREPGTDEMFAKGGTNEVVSESGTSQATTLAATAAQNVCRVAATANIYVSFGTSPVASSDASRFMIPAGSVSVFRVSAGDKVAVVTI